MAKTTYYKLSEISSIFYDPKNRMKITKGVPSKTNDKTKHTADAQRNGHIIEISETEYNNMMDALPEATKAIALKEQKSVVKAVVKKEEPKKKVVAEEETENDNEDDAEDAEERENLINRLEELNLSKKELKKVSAYSNEDLEAYLLDNEE